MRYLLLCPEGARVPWKVAKATPLDLVGDGMAVYWCLGEDPPGGATGMIRDNPGGEIIWWPAWDAPPIEARGLLAGLDTKEQPQEGKENAT